MPAINEIKIGVCISKRLPSINISGMSNEQIPDIYGEEDSPAGRGPKAGDGFKWKIRAEEQPMLFPLEEILIPPSVSVIRKAVSAIHAIPIKAEHNFTRNTRMMFDAFILVAQMEYKRRSVEQKRQVLEDRVSPMYEVRVTELAKLASILGENYKSIYKYIEHVYSMDLHWNVLNEDSSVSWNFKGGLLAILGYGVAGEKGLIRFTIDPEILKIVLEPSLWAKLSLDVEAGLRTTASLALYQTCWKYIGTQHKVTPNLPTETWVRLLIGHSRFESVDTVTGKVIIDYGEFKRRFLNDAIERVNAVKALSHTLELKESKSNKRVIRFQFKFIKKDQETLELPASWPADGIKVLTDMGFSQDAISEMGQAHSYDEVADSLLRLQAADIKMRKLGRPIISRIEFFKGILRNVSAGVSEAALESERIEKELKAQQAEIEGKKRQDRLTEKFRLHQAEVSKIRIFELDDDLRTSLFREFEESSSGASAKPLLKNGWSINNAGALSMFKTWLSSANPEIYDGLLPNPEDQTIEAWTAWRADKLD